MTSQINFTNLNFSDFSPLRELLATSILFSIDTPLSPVIWAGINLGYTNM